MIRILCIVGEAGVGKDTAAAYLAKKHGWNLIHSYTNRPMRECETQGKEHIFVDYCAPETTFAYTHYGNYDYWTDMSQFIEGAVNVYVIDEKGLIYAKEKIKEFDSSQLFCVHISANKEKRSERGVDDKRMDRDSTRTEYDGDYDYNITNDGTIEEFYESLNTIKI